jgi:tRNA (guanine-N7-)-methyltransferase
MPQSIARIFLNFSCPFPKAAYATHRLTHLRFLEIYKRIMKKDAEIHQKTDNMHFFEFSLEQLSLGGFALKNISLDLHNSGFEGNIETEYEHRFASLGQPIYRLEAFIAEENDDRL